MSTSFLQNLKVIILYSIQLDYIPRLMWQAQLRGNKSWSVAPTPECNAVCEKFSFYVEPGDAGKLLYNLWILIIFQLICEISVF